MIENKNKEQNMFGLAVKSTKLKHFSTFSKTPKSKTKQLIRQNNMLFFS